ncbi:DUF2563 family protein [Candidatus Mycobacterium methanotrophicum]|uniref:DUF2563 family protein n=1 Tax=Candidatus Mycobacterium methanotrophicum TaxID=2943498 RepID=A0ABY4QLF2_9MYCO|nr:DUF2563 family protein [Candidatus Mycobacterium methanotrophicum]UQX10786.1 DUF2563 family protein [Candidatus Mycobacterium methanotrophicum]
MFVNTAQLHSGAAQSFRASEHAQDGASHLSAAAPVAGMFGSFADAEAFHDAVSSAHAHHVKTCRTKADPEMQPVVEANTEAADTIRQICK